MTQNATVSVSDLSNPGTDVSQAATLDQLQVIVTIPYQNVKPLDDAFAGHERFDDPDEPGDVGLARGPAVPDHHPAAPDGLSPRLLPSTGPH